jgi:hypothetical protein
MSEPTSLLGAGAVERLRDRFAAVDYTVDGVAERLGIAAQVALSRGDMCAPERATRADDPLATFIRLFVLGLDVSERVVDLAFGSSTGADLSASGILEPAGSDQIRAAIDIRPYAEESGPTWWVVSDFGGESRPLRADHVLGVGAAATTLAQAVVREPVRRALDIGTGCGVQALHLDQHSATVVATDLSRRALAFAATTAALNGRTWELRTGDLPAPVTGEEFDLVVANPPFVVGPAVTTFDYRDSGRSGDGVSAELVRLLPGFLAPSGSAQLLCNWVITADETWSDRVSGWLAGKGCDAWIWQREVADPAEYISLWLRDGGLMSTDPRYGDAYDRWADWFSRNGVLAVGMGLVNLRRTDAAEVVVQCEDVPQALEPPIASSIASWWSRLDWLRECSDSDLLRARLQPAPDLVRSSHAVATAHGWSVELTRLRNAGGMRWEIDTDDDIAALIAGCCAGSSLGAAAALLADSLGISKEVVQAASIPVFRDLVQRGLVQPVP